MSKQSKIVIDVKHQRPDFKLAITANLKSGLTSFFGKSGSGKTSLINLVAGLSEPDEGFISIGNRVVFDSRKKINVPPEQRGIGYVFQDGRLFPHLTVKNNLVFARRFMTPPLKPEMFAQIVDLLDISSLLERRPMTLSGGEKQRVAIGRALLSEPSLLLMDEPLASLDAGRKSEIMPFIENLRDRMNTPILYVSHAMDEVIRLSDQLVLINEGTVVAQGNVEEVMGRLDLKPLTGRYQAGAVFSVRVLSHDHENKLSRLALSEQTIWVPGNTLPVGSEFRLRIHARDVSLSTQKPVGSSVLNIIEATITEIVPEQGPHCEILMDIGAPLIARITRKSASDLKLQIGQKVFASIKAAAIDDRSMGMRKAYD